MLAQHFARWTYKHQRVEEGSVVYFFDLVCPHDDVDTFVSCDLSYPLCLGGRGMRIEL